MKSTRIIAEVGSNYNGDLATAKAYIRASKECGADAVKFQTLRRDLLVAPRIISDGKVIKTPTYQKFVNLELPDGWHYELKEAADKAGIEFFSTPFHLKAVDLLELVGVSTYKIASGDITFLPLLERVGKTGKSVILSTGASSLPDVEQALSVLRNAGAKDIALMHSVSKYPPQWFEMNLRAILTLRDAFDLPVGISDHSPGNIVPIAAVALGATLIEKHVSFDRSLPGPDHPFAMTIGEFADMVRQVRLLEQALGTGEKVPSEDELKIQHRIRRGTYHPDTYQPADGQNGLWLRPEHRP